MARSESKLTLTSSLTQGTRNRDGRYTTLSGWVRSPAANRMTAWELRDLVAKLDEVGAPDRARVIHDAAPETGLTGLRVEWEVAMSTAAMIDLLRAQEEDEREADGAASADALEPGGAGAEAEQGAG